MVFQVALVLALSTPFGIRGVVLAIPLALLVGSDLIIAIAPWAASGIPCLIINRIATGLLGSGDVMAGWLVIAMVGWVGALIHVAVWRSDRQEL